MVKLQQMGEQYTITIPREYVEAKGWSKGQVLVIGFNAEGDIVLKEGRKK